MYEVIFENDNGKTFVFGRRGNCRYGMNIGTGMEVTLGKSQGFASIGETVETQSVGGRTIDVTGEFYGPIVERKNTLRNVCAPLASGRLIFQNKHYIRVYVKAAPSVSPLRWNGIFKMQFFAPYPFFYEFDERYSEIGGIVSGFRFPVNYGTTHHFGVRRNERYVNIINPGDVRVPFRMFIRSTGTSRNAAITNLSTYETLKINGTLNIGEYITIYRDDQNVLRAEKTSGTTVTDVITWIDDDSNLFELAPGDNLISATDDQGGAALLVILSFHSAVGVLYET